MYYVPTPGGPGINWIAFGILVWLLFAAIMYRAWRTLMG